MAIIGGIPRSVNPNTRIKGMDKVLSNLNKEITNIENRSLKGLVMSAALIRNDMEHTPPLTPVDLGNLRASWFVVTASKMTGEGIAAAKVAAGGGMASKKFKGPKAADMSVDHSNTIEEVQGMVDAMQYQGKSTFLIMGYSANYALFVHEMLGAEFKRTGAGPKWLESSFKRNKGRILQMIKDNAQIKK